MNDRDVAENISLVPVREEGKYLTAAVDVDVVVDVVDVAVDPRN